jgi:glycerol uptake facilitator-like aquaporin
MSTVEDSYTAAPVATDPRRSSVNRDLWLLARHAGYELVLTGVLLFVIVTLVRWVTGPGWLSRHIGNLRLEIAIVGALVALVLPLLILSPLGRRSGGHMNPAITLAMWRYKVFPRAGVGMYIAAQLAGSVLGVLLARLAWGPIVDHAPLSDAALQPAAGWKAWELFLAEAVNMTAILAIVAAVLARPRWGGAVPWVIGVSVGATIAVLGPITGGSVNPARQFGPQVISGTTRFLWVYLLAPIAGGLLAPWLRDQARGRQPSTHALCGPTAQRT